MSSISPITTLFPAACAAVALSDANSSHGIVRSPIVFFIWGVSLPFGLPVRQIRKLRCRVHSPFVGNVAAEEVDASALGSMNLVNFV
ncbi:MAG: hypothetical protein ACXU89_24630, partial [Xanthobacteraceae bacterium]